MRAIVFAYHNVGVRCLSTLLAHGVDVPLVITHSDNRNENIWFDSVERLAALNRLPCAIPDNPNTPEWVERFRALQPDFIFSFYYRQMLNTKLLDTARIGAFNMHGSLLPHYRGRAPVNWAVIRGERMTGATLHRMVEKPDAGAVLAQQSVPILPDDTAFDVFSKVTVAAEIALDRVLPQLLAGQCNETPLNLTQGSYFGGRKPEDGRIHWQDSAQVIHNLIRGVAPPYPGAFTELQGKRLQILRSRIEPGVTARPGPVDIFVDGNRLFARCADSRVLELLTVQHDGQQLDAAAFSALFNSSRVVIDY